MHRQLNAQRRAKNVVITSSGVEDWRQLLQDLDTIIFNMKDNDQNKFNDRSKAIWYMVRRFNEENKEYLK